MTLRLLAACQQHFFPDFNQWVSKLADPRRADQIRYASETLLWQGILMFAAGMGSRHQLGLSAGDQNFQRHLGELAGTPEAGAAHPDTMNYFLRHLPPKALLDLQHQMAHRLLRMRCLEAARLDRDWLVPVDATQLQTYDQCHCPHCLSRKLNDSRTQYFHSVLQASLIGPGKFTVPLLSEPIQNAAGGYQKQDCETKAFVRMAPVLKRQYPQLRLCLLGDALYACQAVLDICDKYHWSYILVAKEGRASVFWQTAETVARQHPAQSHSVLLEDGRTRQEYRWACNVPYGQHRVHVIFMQEHLPGGRLRHWAWVTDYRPTKDNVATLANLGGRRRWHIENLCFNALKNGQLALAHDYGSQGHAWYNYYLLALITLLLLHLLWHTDAMAKVSAPPVKSAKDGYTTLKNFACQLHRALLDRHTGTLRVPPPPGGRQLRFDSS